MSTLDAAGSAYEDEVLREIRAVREAIAVECGYDLATIADHARQTAERLGLGDTITLPPRSRDDEPPRIPDDYGENPPADDDVMCEIRQARERSLEQADHDLGTHVEQVRERVRQYGGDQVSLPPRPWPPPGEEDDDDRRNQNR